MNAVNQNYYSETGTTVRTLNAPIGTMSYTSANLGVSTGGR